MRQGLQRHPLTALARLRDIAKSPDPNGVFGSWVAGYPSQNEGGARKLLKKILYKDLKIPAMRRRGVLNQVHHK